MSPPRRSNRPLVILTVLLLAVSSSLTTLVLPSQHASGETQTTASSSQSQKVLLSDSFTKDSALNTGTWQINGPVGSVFGQDDVGTSCSLVPLQPTFSPTGMEISEVSGSCELVTIQSLLSFAPPFNLTAVVEGTVSNGHTFVLGLASPGTTTGIAIIGNLNDDNCSHLGDCGDPSVCGQPFNDSITPNSCFYGIDVKIASGSGGWTGKSKLYLTPSLNVFYTIRVSVNASGFANYSLSQGSTVLGTGSGSIGSASSSFYVVLEQAEGEPVSGQGPNQAYWQSVLVTAPPTASTLSVYPTEPTYATIAVEYDTLSLSSPIHLFVAAAQSLPKGLTISFRLPGTTSFTSSVNIQQPSNGGSSAVQVNATLNCVVGNCNKAGGTQLPTIYSLKVTASSSEGKSQNTTIPVNLLEAKWLVMEYDAPDSILHFGMRQNVLEMAAATKANDNPSVGMLVLWAADSPTSFQPGNAVQATGTIALYKVANGSVTQVGSAWPQTNIFDPATLAKFLTTSMGMVPAVRNQLIMNDHGAGMLGFGKASTTGYLSIPELATALSGVPKLDILSFDACLMSQVEVLYQLASYASYFTASERSIPSAGYDYTGMLTALLSNPDQPTVTYVETIVSTFLAKYTTPYYTRVAGVIPTLAAIDSSQLQGVVSAMNSLSAALVRDYGTKSAQFNQTMLSVLSKTVKCDGSDPYLDVRSFAQNILGSSLTDQNVRSAATAVVQAVKAAVIANTTTSIMYGGLTVLLFTVAQVFEKGYQTFSSVEAQLSFPTAANWFPLMSAINKSAVSDTWRIITLNHPAHQLYLNVYTPTGVHTGYNPALLNASRTAIEVIPGSYYIDFGNGTALIALPSSVQSFTVVIDGTAMEEASEAYTLTYTSVLNGSVASTQTVAGTMAQDTLQSAQVTVNDGILTVGATSVTTATTSATSSSTSSTSGSTAPYSSSTTSASSTSLPLAYLEVVAVVAVVLVSVLAIPKLSGGRSRIEAE